MKKLFAFLFSLLLVASAQAQTPVGGNFTSDQIYNQILMDDGGVRGLGLFGGLLAVPTAVIGCGGTSATGKPLPCTTDQILNQVLYEDGAGDRGLGVYIISGGGGSLPVGTVNDSTLRWDVGSAAWVENINVLHTTAGAIEYTGLLESSAVAGPAFDLYGNAIAWSDATLGLRVRDMGKNLLDMYGYNSKTGFGQLQYFGSNFELGQTSTDSVRIISKSNDDGLLFQSDVSAASGAAFYFTPGNALGAGDLIADFTDTGGATVASVAYNGDTYVSGKLTVDGGIDPTYLALNEQAASPWSGAGYGTLWVKNDTPSTLWYTDDAGTPVQVIGSGGSLPLGTTTNSTLRWNGAAWIEEPDVQIRNGGIEAFWISLEQDVASGTPYDAVGITNENETASGETGQNAAAAYFFYGSTDSGTSWIGRQAARSEAYKLSDWWGGDLTDFDSGLKFYTTEDGSPVVSLDLTPSTVEILQDHDLCFDSGTCDHYMWSDAGTNTLNLDTSGNDLNIDTSAANTVFQSGNVVLGGDGIAGGLDIYDGGVGAAAHTGTFQTATLTADRTWSGPDADGTLLLDGGGGTLPAGTANSTLRWSGSAWVNSPNVQSTAASDLTVLGKLAVGQNAVPATTFEIYHAAGGNPTMRFRDGDVNHGMTGLPFIPAVTTDTSGQVGPAAGLDGGIHFIGISDADNFSLVFDSIIGDTAPTEVPTVFRSAKYDGVNDGTNLADNEEHTQFEKFDGTPIFTLFGNGTFSSQGNALIRGGTGTFGTLSVAGALVLSDGDLAASFGTIQTTDLTVARTYTLPDASGTFLLDGGGGSLPASTQYHFLTGSTGGAWVDNSNIVTDATNGMTINSGDLKLGILGNVGQLAFNDGAAPNVGTLQPATLGAARTWTLPDASGTIALTGGGGTLPASSVSGSLLTGTVTGWSEETGITAASNAINFEATGSPATFTSDTDTSNDPGFQFDVTANYGVTDIVLRVREDVSGTPQNIITLYGAASPAQLVVHGDAEVENDLYMADDNWIYLSTDPSNAIRFNTTDTVVEIASASGVQVTNDLTVGDQVAATDYTLTFDGETSQGVLTWMEDEDRLDLAATGFAATRFHTTDDVTKYLSYNSGSTRFEFNESLYVNGDMDVRDGDTYLGSLVEFVNPGGNVDITPDNPVDPALNVNRSIWTAGDIYVGADNELWLDDDGAGAVSKSLKWDSTASQFQLNGALVSGADSVAGVLGLYDGGTGASAFTGTITTGTLTADRAYDLPDADGTLATTSDIPAAIWSRNVGSAYLYPTTGGDDVRLTTAGEHLVFAADNGIYFNTSDNLMAYASGTGYLTINPTNALYVGNDTRLAQNLYMGLSNSTPGHLYMADNSASNYWTHFTTVAQSADIDYTLPPDDGDADEVLTTDGNGVLTWEPGASLPASSTQYSVLVGDGAAGWVDQATILLNGGSNEINFTGAGTAVLAVDATSPTTALQVLSPNDYASGGILFEVADTAGTPQTLFTVDGVGDWVSARHGTIGNGSAVNYALNFDGSANDASLEFTQATDVFDLSDASGGTRVEALYLNRSAGWVESLSYSIGSTRFELTGSLAVLGGATGSGLVLGDATAQGSIVMWDGSGNTGLIAHPVGGISASRTWRFPDATGDILLDGGGGALPNGGTDNAVLTWNTAGTNWLAEPVLKADAAGATIGNNGAIDYTLTFDAVTNDGLITWNNTGDYFNIGDDIQATSGNLYLGNATTDSHLRLYDGSSNYTEFTVPALAADVVYTLPPDDGDPDEFLKTNGTGTLTWEDVPYTYERLIVPALHGATIPKNTTVWTQWHLTTTYYGAHSANVDEVYTCPTGRTCTLTELNFMVRTNTFVNPFTVYVAKNGVATTLGGLVPAGTTGAINGTGSVSFVDGDKMCLYFVTPDGAAPAVSLESGTVEVTVQ